MGEGSEAYAVGGAADACGAAVEDGVSISPWRYARQCGRTCPHGVPLLVLRRLSRRSLPTPARESGPPFSRGPSTLQPRDRAAGS